jgi:hypothetical protein
MQTKFKRHQDVIIKNAPNPEYVEYHEGHDDAPIQAGMKGKINLIMPTGEYHVEIFDKSGTLIAYALMHEEELEEI